MNIYVKSICIFTCTWLLYSCGVGDYINSKKIANAPSYETPAKTSECDFSERRIQRVTKYLNKIRASAQLCGDTNYPIAPAIQWNHKLSIAAKSHSNDMAENDFFNHLGSAGSRPSDRVSNTGYDWKTVAENIAGGADTPEQALEQWLSSPGHCHNMMSANHREFALACTRNNISEYRIYWTLVLASPNANN